MYAPRLQRRLRQVIFMPVRNDPATGMLGRIAWNKFHGNPQSTKIDSGRIPCLALSYKYWFDRCLNHPLFLTHGKVRFCRRLS